VKRASIPTQGAGAEVGPIKQDLDPVAAAELQVRLAAIEDQATGAGSEDGPRSSAVGCWKARATERRGWHWEEFGLETELSRWDGWAHSTGSYAWPSSRVPYALLRVPKRTKCILFTAVMLVTVQVDRLAQSEDARVGGPGDEDAGEAQQPAGFGPEGGGRSEASEPRGDGDGVAAEGVGGALGASGDGDEDAAARNEDGEGGEEATDGAADAEGAAEDGNGDEEEADGDEEKAEGSGDSFREGEDSDAASGGGSEAADNGGGDDGDGDAGDGASEADR
jgi:hypothetical protein